MLKQILLLSGFLLLLGFEAGAQLNVAIQMDPNPSPYISDWRSNPNTIRFVVTNPTGADVEVRFTGFIEGDARGKVAETVNDAPIPPVVVPPGTTIFNAVDIHMLDEGVVVYSGAASEETRRSGRLPEDNFRLCIQLFAYSAPFNALSPEVCSRFDIRLIIPPMLIAPVNSSEVKTAPGFQWSVVQLGLGQFARYELSVVELDPGQKNYAQALKSNIPLIQRETIISTYQILPADPQLEKGHTYAWQVRAFDMQDQYMFVNDGYSEIWVFEYNPIVPPGISETKTPVGVKTPVNVVKPDLSQINVQPNFIYAGLTRLQGTLLTTFYKSHIPKARSVTIYDPKYPSGKSGKPPSSKPQTQQQVKPPSGTATGTKIAMQMGNVFALLGKKDVPLGGIHLKLYRCVRTEPLCGYFPINAGGKTYSDKELVATTTTKPDGSFEFMFFAKDSTGRILKNAQITCGSKEFVGQVTGDLYRYYRVEVSDPHLCSPSDEFSVQPGESGDAENIYSLVRSYNAVIQVSDKEQPDLKLSGMNVTIMRRNRPFDVPETEGTLDPHDPAYFPAGAEIIARGETDPYGRCTFKHMAKNAGGSDYYDLIVSNPEESVYYYATLWRTFDFGFMLNEKDELNNTLVWDQMTFNEDYDPDIMNAVVDARMIPKLPRIKGRVYRADNTNQPLAYSHVTLYRAGKTLTAVTTCVTNDSGGFVFDGLVPTTGDQYYFLKIEKYGYKLRIEPQNLNVDKIKLKKGQQRTFQKILLEPKLVVHGKIIDEFGRPVAATVRIGTGENVHTIKKIKPKPLTAVPPALSVQTMQVNPMVQQSATAKKMRIAPKKKKLSAAMVQIAFDEEFTTPAPTGMQFMYIMPDNIELYHPDTLLVMLPDGTEDLGDFVVYVKAHRLAVRAIAYPPPTPKLMAPLKSKSKKKSSQVQLQASLPTTPPKAGSTIALNIVTGPPLQLSMNQFMLSLGTAIVVPGCTMTVNGEAADSVDASGVHYFVWFSAGDDAEIAVEGPPNKDYVPKTVMAVIDDETPAWHEMNIPMELGGRLTGMVMVGEVPIPGARVALYDNPAETEAQQTYTDGAGKYTLHGLRAGVHTFLAAKSKSQFVGDTASIEIQKGQESVLDFELTAYADMDITSLLGFPIEVTALDSISGAVTISGTFIELPGNTQFAPEDSSNGIPFADVVITPSSENNANGIPYSQPTVVPLVTPVNSWDITASEGIYSASQHDAVNGLRVRQTGDRGEIIGSVSIKPSSFTFPGGSLDLGSTQITLSMDPASPEGLVIPAITSDKSPSSGSANGFMPVSEDGSALRFELYDFPAESDSTRSYFKDDTLSIATILHTNIDNIANPDMAIDIGELRIHHNAVENISSAEEMQIVLEGDWKIAAKSWTLDHNGLSLDSGTIRAAFLGVPFKGLQIMPDQISFGSFDLDKLIMSDAAEIFVTGKTQFGYDNGTKHWALSVAPKTLSDDECGWMMPVPPMEPTDRIRFNNFFLQSSGSKGFTMKPGATVTLSKVGQYAINQFIPKEEFIQIAGSLELGIPNLPMINQIGTIFKEDDETVFRLDPINETIAVNGVKIKFKTAEGQQDWQTGGLHSGVVVSEDGAFALNSMLHHTPTKTEVIVNDGEVVDIGTEVKMTDVVGAMLVNDNAWDLFWFEGDLQNNDQGGRLRFTVQGDIVASGQKIGVDKIETPFGDISLIYNFQEQQLEGTLHVEQDLDGTSIVGDATLLVSGAGKGWYFFCGASFQLPQPKVDGTAAFAVGHFKLTQKQLDQFAEYSYQNKGLPPQFHNFNGFFFEGTVLMPPPVFCPNFDFDFGIVSAYMICQVGANARFGMNFGPVDTYFISIRGIGKLEAGVGMSVIIACAGVSAGILIEPNVEGMYQSDGTWYVLGDFPITLYGTAYAGWGICDSECDGALCDKESVSASITLGMKGYVGSDDKYFKFYFK